MCTAKGPFAANVCRCRAGGNRDQKSEHMAVEYPDKTILQRMAEIPPVYDKERAGRTSDDLKQAANAAADADEAAALSFLLSDGAARKLLASVTGNSPYLARQILKDPLFAHTCLTQSPEMVFYALLREIEQETVNAADEAAAMKAVRRGKNKGALLIALCDIANIWPVEMVTVSLTQLADTCLASTAQYLLREAQIEGIFDPYDAEHPADKSGIAIIAMGKYGAHELNYSSDIDFCVYYDPDRCPTAGGREAQPFAIRLAKDLVKMMQEPTEDGYVFRTDLRLRPDAGSTAIAVSIAAAEHYYESMGQNWERAAMIKARPAAGDIALGEEFLAALRPFIWRKYLDYAAIEDIHAIKRQIHAHRGHSKLAVPGHNIKLGYGGIREIEFFVQTQQLILGGRIDALRVRKTCDGLDALYEEKMISQATCEELKHSYDVLRTLEHRLQMIEDAQTHTIPDEKHALENVAKFSGFKSRRDFERHVLFHLTRVHNHYTALFEKEAPLASETGNLVFTGVEDDPQTIDNLKNMGFTRPEQVAETIRGWHFGRVRATRSERARELLTKLMPRLLESISGTSEPDVTFARFTEFLEGLPAGIQLFSLFYSHPELLDLVVNVLGTAPRLAPYLAKNAGVFDAVLDDDFLVEIPKESSLRKELKARLTTAGDVTDFEDALNAARRFGKDEQFRIGIQLLRGVHTAKSAGAAYSQLADILMQTLAPIALNDVIQDHGTLRGAEYAVLAMGKYGSSEMTASSDVDLILVYDYAESAVESDGDHPLDPTRYFTRFAQRLIAALSAQTAEGRLYEVDMQLRPSGKAGPVATKFERFASYYQQDAWTWELMALTRARVVAGTPELTKKLTAVIAEALCNKRDHDQLVDNVLSMRERLFKEKGTDNIWNLKHTRGGLVDLEFIVQFLQLNHAYKHPKILTQNTQSALAKLQSAGIIDGKRKKTLTKAANLLSILNQYTRLCVDGPLQPATAGEALRNLLAHRTNAKTFPRLEQDLEAALSDVALAFDALIQ